MRLVGVAVAGLLFAAGPASAQYIPRPMIPIGPPSAYDVAEIVQAMGLDPIGPPTRSGAFHVQRARDDFGRVLRVTVDARRSQVVAVEAGAPRALYGPHAGYAPYRRPYPGYAALPPDDDADLASPGSIIGRARAATCDCAAHRARTESTVASPRRCTAACREVRRGNARSAQTPRRGATGSRRIG